jgi:thiol:disulfide interchange protein DsbD
VAELRGQGRTVLVDFTARWCLTCQVNERVALDNAAVKEALRAGNVAALRADWTDRDDGIARTIASLGRAGVPLYVLYRPGVGEPLILPEILTPRIVLDALEAPR